MEDLEHIRTTFERNARALALRPGVGQGTAVTRVRLRAGLVCDIEDGRWKFVGGMSSKAGGSDAGPDPGVFGRAALGSCLALGYAMWAAKLGVPVAGLEVEIQADYDTRGSYGVGDASPGYRQVRYVVTVHSDAPENMIHRLLDEADAHSPYHDIFRRPVDLRREVRVVPPLD